VIEAGLLRRNPPFSIERRFPGQALEAELVTQFIDIYFCHFASALRKRNSQRQSRALEMKS